jgi:formylglycine-generating enzyme required for sulfatase activity
MSTAKAATAAVALACFGAALSSFGAGAHAVTVSWVPVGDVGNAPDTHGYGHGAVSYPYWISKYEVTNAQYREFLNAKAAVGDPYGLYNPHMEDAARPYAGIQRSGSGTATDPWVYSPKDGDTEWDSRPVSYVCWYDAIRFVNWLQNGQGSGDTETGTYTITDGGFNSGTVVVPDHSLFTSPHVVLPTEDEWYKAAFYKGGSINAGYWDYATQSNAVPDNNPPGSDTGNSVNYNLDPGYAVGPPYYTTPVGAYALSGSAYGTFDQDGNVWEWNETLIYGSRGLRGGAWSRTEYVLRASYRYYADPTMPKGENVGFRVGNVAPIPEPVTVLSLTLGIGALGAYVRRRLKRR